MICIVEGIHGKVVLFAFMNLEQEVLRVDLYLIQ